MILGRGLHLLTRAAFPLLMVIFGLGMGLSILKVDPILTIGGLLCLGLLMAIFVWPETGTLLVIFAIYANVPVIASRFHGVPVPVATATPLLLGIPLAHYLIIRREALILDRAFLFMLAFLVVLCAASFFAQDIYVARNYVSVFVFEGLAIYGLTINVVRTAETLRRVVWVLILTGGLIGTLTLYQRVTGSYDQQFGGLAQTQLTRQSSIHSGGKHAESEGHGSHRATGQIGRPNRFAQTMIVLIPLALFRFWGERTRWLRLGALAAMLLTFCGVLLSYSRGAFLALALVCLLLTYMRHIRLYQIAVAVPLLLLFISVAAPNFLLRIGSIQQAQGLFSDDDTDEPDGSTRGRATEMLAALMVFLDHPILGVGPGQYTPFYSMQYQLDPDIAFKQIARTRRAHNLYVEMAAETGIIGLVAFMTIVLSLMTRLWGLRRYWSRRRQDLTCMVTGFWLSLAAYLTHAVFAHLSYQRYYWLLLALAGAAIQIAQSEAARQEEPAAAI